MTRLCIFATVTVLACGGQVNIAQIAPEAGSDEAGQGESGIDGAVHLDSAADAGLPDAPPQDSADGTASDGAAWDAAEAEAGLVTFCSQATAAQWCEDWDESATPSGAWSATQTGSAVATVETAKPISPPQILHGSSTGTDVAFLTRGAHTSASAGTSQGIDVDFDVRFDSVPPSGNLGFLKLEGTTTTGPDHATVVLASGNIALEGGQGSGTTTGTVLPDTPYHGKLRLWLVCAGTCGTWLAILDMGTLGSVPYILTGGGAGNNGGFVSEPLLLKVGMVSASGLPAGGTASVRIDNIVVN